MTSSVLPTYVGFGFGAIQAGLFLYEAWRSGNIGRLVVAEVVPEVVAAVRVNGGYYLLNIAHAERVESVRVGPIEIYNPAVEEDRAHLIDAIAAAQEMGTAVPTINFYASDAPGSIHCLLAAGLRQKIATGNEPCWLYAAENHNHAAETLQAQVFGLLSAAEQASVQGQVSFLNTVITKMCGVVASNESLPAIAPTLRRAFLVEAFNRIQVQSPAHALPHAPGLAIFAQRENLLPYKETKLFAINSIHAMAAYLGQLRGIERISQLSEHPDLLTLLRAAISTEIAPALAHKYGGIDPFFTVVSITHYAHDYIDRMINPFLQDSVERVGRDPARKLAWDDRLIGAMRLALQAGITPQRYALGAAAALSALAPHTTVFPRECLLQLWQPAPAPTPEAAQIVSLIEQEWYQLPNINTA